MSFNKLLNIKKHINKLAITALMAAAAFIPLGATQTLAETLRIEVNKASILKLTETPSTIIIGNPALADVTPQANNVLVLVGKASGRTNIIILDDDGNVMHNYDIAVQEEQSGNLTLYKAGKQWSYSCAPYCERVINPNDDTDAFSINMAQVTAKSTQMSKAVKDASSGGEEEGFGPSSNSIHASEGGEIPAGAIGQPSNSNFSDEELKTFTVLPPQR